MAKDPKPFSKGMATPFIIPVFKIIELIINSINNIILPATITSSGIM